MYEQHIARWKKKTREISDTSTFHYELSPPAHSISNAAVL